MLANCWRQIELVSILLFHQRFRVGKLIFDVVNDWQTWVANFQHVRQLFLCLSHTITWVCQHKFANFSLSRKGRFSHSHSVRFYLWSVSSLWLALKMSAFNIFLQLVINSVRIKKIGVYLSDIQNVMTIVDLFLFYFNVGYKETINIRIKQERKNFFKQRKR